jgi:hypothetical protein
MWEHPKLSESLRRVFREEGRVIPKRNLNDTLLQSANQDAYMRFLGKKSSNGGELTIPLMARNTYRGIESNFGAALNYSDPTKFTLENMVSRAPQLMRSKTFSYRQWINWKWQYKVEYDSLPSMPSNNGIVSEVGLYQFQPTNNSWLSWNNWIYDDWYEVCQSTPIKCKNIIGQGTLSNHVRVRYRAYISPDPLEHAYFNADSGAVFGEIHSSQSGSVGIIGHQLIVEADVATTESNFFMPQALASPGFGEAVPVALFGIDIINLTTNKKVNNEFSVMYGEKGAKMEYTFAEAGLYQIFIYLKSTEGQGITVSEALKKQISNRGGNVSHASHPLRLLVFVSPPPKTTMPDVIVDVEDESLDTPTLTTQTDTVQLVDSREDESEPDYNYLVVVGLLAGSLLLFGRDE